MMILCDDGHEEIVFQGDDCPLCKAMYDKKRKHLRKEVNMGHPKKWAVVISIFAFSIFSHQPFAYGIDHIDLVKAKINDVYIFDLTVETVTDLLGKPESITPSEQAGSTKFGIWLSYYKAGLLFTFRHSEIEKEQYCSSVTIYLVRTDERGRGIIRGIFDAYPGKILRDVNRNWTARNVMQTFADCNPIDLYNPEYAALKKAMYKGSWLKFEISTITRIEIYPPNSKHQVHFQYDENTKFIERITVLPTGPGQDR
jgi:hypothetical protein